MRHPSDKHNVGRLRIELNKFEKFDQKRFADLIGCSVCKLQNIETGRTRLDELLAGRISEETGASMKSLLNKAAPLIAQDGREYTKAIYDEVQARKKYFVHVDKNTINYNALEFLRTILNILINANRKRNYYVAAYRTWKVLNELRNEFGADEKIWAYLEEPYPQGLPLATLPEHAKNIWDALAKLAQAKRDHPTAPKSKSKRPLKKRQRR